MPASSDIRPPQEHGLYRHAKGEAGCEGAAAHPGGSARAEQKDRPTVRAALKLDGTSAKDSDTQFGQS